MTPAIPKPRRRGGSLAYDPRLADPTFALEGGLVVRYVNPSDAACWRGTDNPRQVLVLGTTYAVQHRRIGAFQTTLALVGHEGKHFNSVHFEVVDGEGGHTR